MKHENFKKCSQSGFCTRNRNYADSAVAQGAHWKAPYRLDAASIDFKNGQLHGNVLKTISNNEQVFLPLVFSFLESGVARVTLDETKRKNGEIELRHDSKIRKERYNEAEKWAIVGGLEPSSSAELSADNEPGFTKVLYGPDKKFEAIIRHEPFEVAFRRDGVTHIQFNDRGLINMEHWRQKKEAPPKPEGEEAAGEEQPASETGQDEFNLWDESYGGNTDSKPRGPESVGLDISFPGYEHVFGIPEHADSMSLKQTR